MASNHGVSNWLDLKYWHHAKLPISLTHIIPYIKNTTAIIASLYGGTKKVLVLDLDNTLWGGVIGDDGLDGIKVGQGSPEGEAFYSFQKYIQQLKDRGVLLAVCSKNDDANARQPFEQHPEMHLKLDDFVSFIANWRAKPDNLIDIAKQLNLGLDSFVFVDDNPAERELMRTQLPDVLTIELNDNPADYARLLDEQNPFELTSLSSEDTIRTSQYKENLQRDSLKTSIADYDDYLKSLEQIAVISDFNEARLDRITQLINKTNQFNLTSIRKNRSEVEQLMADDDSFTCYIQLSDKFGDNGVIAIVYGSWGKDSLTIDGWLMSCRVLKRGVEKMTCNHLVKQAHLKNKKYIHGRYIPSAKNSMVKDLYPELGFELSATGKDQTTDWTLDLSTYAIAAHTIKIEEN
jgi:FkbH-like protein